MSASLLFFSSKGCRCHWKKCGGGAGNWKLHVIIQSFTFLIFPIVGLAFSAVVRKFWPSEPGAIRDGFLFLCVLPSTVSTSVVLTAVAGGNTAAAILSAAFSNIVGVVLTPVLVSLLMHATGKTAASGSFGPLLLEITMLTLVPFAVGVGFRPLIRHWVDANKKWVNRISNSVILFFVYSAFCDSVKERIWQQYGLLLTGQILAGVVALFSSVSLLTIWRRTWRD